MIGAHYKDPSFEWNIFYFRFLPNIARQSLEKLLSTLNVVKPEALESEGHSDKCIIEGDTLKIRNTTAKRFPDTTAKSKVPDILFYDVPQVFILFVGHLFICVDSDPYDGVKFC